MKRKLENNIITVIIPIYQAETCVKRCVDSVVNQTYKNLDIILIDDGSQDNSYYVCKKMEKEDSRIRVFHQENAGVAATRNKGLDFAIGKYVFFLDSDDWIEKNTLSEMKKELEKDSTDICICGFNYVGKDVRMVSAQGGTYNKQEFMKNIFWDLYEKAILFNIGTKLYKRHIIEKYKIRFSEHMVVYEDIEFFLEYLKYSEKIHLSPKAGYYYYLKNGESITHTYQTNFTYSTLVYCDMLKERFEGDDDSLKRAIFLCIYRAYLHECHNPHLERDDFYKLLETQIFPAVEKFEICNKHFEVNSIDKKIFKWLTCHYEKACLWRLAQLIFIRG